MVALCCAHETTSSRLRMNEIKIENMVTNSSGFTMNEMKNENVNKAFLDWYKSRTDLQLKIENGKWAFINDVTQILTIFKTYYAHPALVAEWLEQ